MLYILLSIFLYLADQVTKKEVDKRIPLGKSISLIERKLYVTNVRNTGAMMGLFSKNRKWLMGLSFLSVMVWGDQVLRTMRRVGNSRLLKTAAALMSAGAAGNLTNRIKDRYVTDFIYFDHKNAPIFNLADLFILIGSILYMVKSFMTGDQNKA